MKYILNFAKFSEKGVNEMFDDENTMAKNEIDFLTGKLDKKALATPTEFFSNRLNKAILQYVPFFKKGNPEVSHDLIVYRFGDEKERLIVQIKGGLVNDKYHKNSFEVTLYIEENNKCINPQAIGDYYPISELMPYLAGLVPIIEKDFNVTPAYAELN